MSSFSGYSRLARTEVRYGEKQGTSYPLLSTVYYLDQCIISIDTR